MAERERLVIIGAGPAGLAAASRAMAAGVETLLLDEQPRAGGQIYRAVDIAGEARRRVLGEDYTAGADLLQVLREKGLDYRPRSTVWEITPEGVVYYSRDGRAAMLSAGQVILCPGALERSMPFPGWTLPGVMTCGAAQILLKGAGAFPDGNVILAGSGPLLLLLANQLLAAGTQPTAVVDTTPRGNYAAALGKLPGALRTPGYLGKGVGMMWALHRAGVPWYRAATGVEALGDELVEGLRFTAGGKLRDVECGLLLLHQGVVPNVQLSRSLGLQHIWDKAQRCWRPQLDAWGGSKLPRIAISGDGAGIMGARAAAAHGELAALGSLVRLGVLTAEERDRLAEAPRRTYERETAPRPFLDRLYQPHPDYLRPGDDTIVCRCEEVTAGQIREFVELGCLGPNQAKAFGRSGMGPCQGRVCGLSVSEVIAGARNVSPAEVGYYRIRPPIKPVTLGELAAMIDGDPGRESI